MINRYSIILATSYHLIMVSNEICIRGHITCLKAYMPTTQAISIHFSWSKSTKCDIFGCLLNSPDKKLIKCQFEHRKIFEKT